MMDRKDGDISIYGLITELCERFIDKNKPAEHPYLPRSNTSEHLKRIRSRAFEILLKKSSTKYEDHQNDTADPVVELLKHAFVMRSALGHFSRAEELENSLDQLPDEEGNLDESVYYILQFLNGLKSLETKEENTLEIFHYGRPNPLLPEYPNNPKEVPRYQVYPMEAFVISDRFESMLALESSPFQLAERQMDPYESLSFANNLQSTATIGIETLSAKSERTIGTMVSAPRYEVRLVSTREFSTSPYFVPGNVDDDGDEEYERSAEPETPWLCIKSPSKDDETASDTSEIDVRSSNVRTKCSQELRLEIWEDIDDSTEVTEHRTWERLGRNEVPKEAPFLTETNEVMSHLERMKHAGFLLLLPSSVVDSLEDVSEVPTQKFMEDTKLLLLGVESGTFIWNDKVGFRLVRNTTVTGLSVEALESACQDVTYWGGCYKSLDKLVKPDPQTGKMQQEGLIFRAMCNSVKEFLLYYQAVILRLTVDKEDNRGLLRLLKYVRPVGSMIAEVARLCRCDRENRETLGEGLGILSHIYEQVTGVTEPNVALVFYSILKSCCEVYFRLLQKWLFEGICADEYGEFMIKIRPQYARDRRHSFWTKAFAVNKNSVPGFLGGLAESILQCGKTVRLLKICDPKNPLNARFENSRPTVRVCLSVGTVREQESMCREFLNEGEKLLGRNVSFAVAFEEQRHAEKERAELVMNAQRDTLARIKRERYETKIEEARSKREFLAQLKDQAEQVATRREREREAELLKDKRYLEDSNAAYEITKNLLIADKQNTLDYYNELASEAERRRARAEWRNKRMKLFQERADFMIRTKAEMESVGEKDVGSHGRAEGLESITEKMATEANVVQRSIAPSVVEEAMENSPDIANTRERRSPEVANSGNSEKIIEISDLPRETRVVTAKRSPRPNVLDIKKTTRDKPPLNINECRETPNDNWLNATERSRDPRLGDSDNMTDLQKNKFRVLQQEYGMTPNNNELNIIVMDSEGNENTISIDASTIANENTRKGLEIEMERNRNRNTRHQTDSWMAEVMATEKNRNISDGEEKNSNENPTVHHRGKEEFPEARMNVEVGEMTAAQKNRVRNMAHTYQDVCTATNNGRVNFVETTDLQRNRAKVMGHDDRNYRDSPSSDETNVAFHRADSLTPKSQAAECGITPMSCTTDTFATSNSGSLTQLHNWDESFHAEAKTTPTTNVDAPFGDSAFVIDGRGTPVIGNDFCFRSNRHPKFFGLEAAESATPASDSSLTVEDVAMIDNTSLQVYLEKSVVIPLRAQSRLANAAIIRYLIYDCNVLSHLRSLRSFFFLLNGEFAKSLTNSLYTRLYEISVPMELFKTSTLTNFLEQALNSSLSSTYENSERLSLSASDVPSQLQVSDPEFLNCICLNYKISWPLNIIIDERILEQYSKVLKFLLMVGRVLYVLQEDFHILKVERKSAMTLQYHKLQLYRHSMMQFITALHNYLTCSVLHESWTEFEKELAHATTIDEIYMTHVSYIKKILSRCMLTSRGEKMRTFLCSIFKVILKFHNRVRSQQWSTSSPGFSQDNFNRLEYMYKTFCDARTYLAHVADKLARSGYQPHLTHFLNALNINPLYDLTDMTSSKKR